MTHATRYASAGIAALAVLSLGHWLRARAVFDSLFVTFILGVLPNVAAAVAQWVFRWQSSAARPMMSGTRA